MMWADYDEQDYPELGDRNADYVFSNGNLVAVEQPDDEQVKIDKKENKKSFQERRQIRNIVLPHAQTTFTKNGNFFIHGSTNRTYWPSLWNAYPSTTTDEQLTWWMDYDFGKGGWMFEETHMTYDKETNDQETNDQETNDQEAYDQEAYDKEFPSLYQ